MVITFIAFFIAVAACIVVHSATLLVSNANHDATRNENYCCSQANREVFYATLLDEIDVSGDSNQPQSNRKPFAGLERLPDDVLPSDVSLHVRQQQVEVAWRHPKVFKKEGVVPIPHAPHLQIIGKIEALSKAVEGIQAT